MHRELNHIYIHRNHHRCRDELEPLFRGMQVQAALPTPRQEEAPARKVEAAGPPARLAFSLKEADVLGVSSATMYRLLQRGLLRSSGALRCKLIPKAEVERFLKETTTAAY